MIRETTAERKDDEKNRYGRSNGQHLIPNLLHEDKNVIIEERFTIEDAVGDIPRCNDEVTDVVMVVGFNNIRKPNSRIYQSPKALFHIGSVSPMNEKCIQFNVELQNLAQNRNASFISTEPML